MVGIANEDFYAGDDCYIVLQKPDGSKEFLEGKFLETLPETHHAWQELRKRGFSEYARLVRAMVVNVPTIRDSIDSVTAGQEPFRSYSVVSVKNYIGLLEKELSTARDEITAAQERLASKLTERDPDVSLAQQGFEDRVTKYAEQYAAKAAALENQNEALRKGSTKLLLAYLAIGIAFGVGGTFGGLAAYRSYQSNQAQKPETVFIRK